MKLPPNLLAESTVRDIALPILRHHLATFGFEDATVADEEDFDGDHILRMIARVTDDVPARALTDATVAVNKSLLSNGDERFVFLSARTGIPDIVDDEE